MRKNTSTFDIIFRSHINININFLIEQIIDKKSKKKYIDYRHKKDDIEITSKLNITNLENMNIKNN